MPATTPLCSTDSTLWAAMRRIRTILTVAECTSPMPAQPTTTPASAVMTCRAASSPITTQSVAAPYTWQPTSSPTPTDVPTYATTPSSTTWQAHEEPTTTSVADSGQRVGQTSSTTSSTATSTVVCVCRKPLPLSTIPFRATTAPVSTTCRLTKITSSPSTTPSSGAITDSTSIRLRPISVMAHTIHTVARQTPATTPT